MKTLNIPLEDAEYEELLKKKGAKNWHDFVLELAGPQEEVRK